MYVLITYDVDTTTPNGAKRLRNVAKICQNYGQRVQNSVFECSLSESIFLKVKDQLINTIDDKEDSIRIYHLGKNWKNAIEQYGRKTSFDIDAPLII